MTFYKEGVYNVPLEEIGQYFTFDAYTLKYTTSKTSNSTDGTNALDNQASYETI